MLNRSAGRSPSGIGDCTSVPHQGSFRMRYQEAGDRQVAFRNILLLQTKAGRVGYVQLTAIKDV